MITGDSDKRCRKMRAEDMSGKTTPRQVSNPGLSRSIPEFDAQHRRSLRRPKSHNGRERDVPIVLSRGERKVEDFFRGNGPKIRARGPGGRSTADISRQNSNNSSAPAFSSRYFRHPPPRPITTTTTTTAAAVGTARSSQRGAHVRACARARSRRHCRGGRGRRCKGKDKRRSPHLSRALPERSSACEKPHRTTLSCVNRTFGKGCAASNIVFTTPRWCVLTFPAPSRGTDQPRTRRTDIMPQRSPTMEVVGTGLSANGPRVRAAWTSGVALSGATREYSVMKRRVIKQVSAKCTMIAWRTENTAEARRKSVNGTALDESVCW